MIKTCIEKLKALRIYTIINSLLYPVYTYEQIKHTDKQELELKYFVNGKHTHTSTFHYLTIEQFHDCL